MLRRIGVFLIGFYAGMASAETASEIVIPDYQPPGAAAETSSPANFDNMNSVENSASIKNSSLSDPKALAAWQDYFSKLSPCEPGTFALSQINPILSKQYGAVVTNKINGIRNGRCDVTIMYYAENDPRIVQNAMSDIANQMLKYPAGEECHFSKSTVDDMIEFDLKLLKGEEVKIGNNDPHSKAIAEECAPFVVIKGEKMVELAAE